MHRLDDQYEVYALRFASWKDRRAGDFFFRYDLYDVEDRPLQMDFYFWLIGNDQSVVLLDCGYDRERGERRGRQQDQDPIELLARFDVSPTDVDHVIISHMHFDHIGNVTQFPDAEFSVARAELHFWTDYGHHPAVALATESEEVRAIQQLQREGRLHLVDESAEPLPGIKLQRVGGHTPGSIITEVATANGKVVLASDVLHFYEEMEHDRPFFLYSDIEEVFDAYELLRNMAARPDVSVVAGHDPLVMSRFRSIDDDCVDLTHPRTDELR